MADLYRIFDNLFYAKIMVETVATIVLIFSILAIIAILANISGRSRGLVEAIIFLPMALLVLLLGLIYMLGIFWEENISFNKKK